MRRSRLLWLTTLGIFLTVADVRSDDWPAFRGPRGDGATAETTAPLRWSSQEGIRWKTALPAAGNGSPIVANNRVWIAGPGGDKTERGLSCYDRRDGGLLWSKTVRFTGEDPTHRTNPYCSSTPVTNGKQVIVWHGSAGLHCYDLDGEPLWNRDLGVFKHIWGYGSSPVIHGDRVFLNCGPGERSFVTAIDVKTGQTLWQVDEPGGASGEKGADEWIGSWSTPVVARIDGRDQVIVSLPHHVNAYDPADGTILWSCDGLGKLVYTSPLIGEGIGVAMGGYHGPAIGFRLGGSGNITESNRLWLNDKKNPQRIGSGVVVGRYLYMANEQHIAQCMDITTGKDLWEARMPQGVIWGSLVRVANRLYVSNQQGTTLVFRADPEGFELLAENKLDEPSNSTPAVSNGEIFLRTNSHLYCIGE